MVGDSTDAGDGSRADLGLEAGGVRGLGLVGAVAALASAGYSFPRVAGTSVGAVTGAVVAALLRAGEPISRLEEIGRSRDTARLRDRGGIGRALGPLGFLTDVVSLFRECGRDPDDQRVLDAVLAAAEIPFFFDPVLLTVPGGASATLVDGAMVSSYPIALFDRTDAAPPRRPTFGVRLSAREPAQVPTRRVRGLVGLALASQRPEVGEQRQDFLPACAAVGEGAGQRHARAGARRTFGSGRPPRPARSAGSGGRPGVRGRGDERAGGQDTAYQRARVAQSDGGEPRRCVHDDLDVRPRHGRAPPRPGRRHCRAVKTRRQDSMTGTLWRDMPACRDQNVPVVGVHQREGGPDRSAWITAETAPVGADARAFSDPCVVSRSVFVDTGDACPVDFDLSVTANEALIAGGRTAAHDFLSHWNEPAYLRHCRGVAA